VTKKTHGIDNCFLPKFIDFRCIFFKDDLSSQAFISLKYTFRYLLQLWLANNEGGKTTFVEISRIVLEITRQIYDGGNERNVRHVVAPLSSETLLFVSSGRKF